MISLTLAHCPARIAAVKPALTNIYSIQCLITNLLTEQDQKMVLCKHFYGYYFVHLTETRFKLLYFINSTIIALTGHEALFFDVDFYCFVLCNSETGKEQVACKTELPV